MGLGAPDYFILNKRRHPDDLKIGSIIASPHHLSVLNASEGERLEFEEARLKTFKFSLKDSRKTQDSASTGIGATVPTMAAVSGVFTAGRADLSMNRKTAVSVISHAVHVSQVDFYAQDYKKAFFQSLGVHEYLENMRYKEAVYIVTGVMIAPELAKTLLKEGLTKGTLQAGIDAGPIQFGPKISGLHAESWEQEYDEKNDGVLALRLTELTYKRTGLFGMMGKRKLKHEPYESGAELVGRRVLGHIDEGELDVGANENWAEQKDGAEAFEAGGIRWILMKEDKNRHEMLMKSLAG